MICTCICYDHNAIYEYDRPPAETHTWLYMQPLDPTGTKVTGDRRIVLRNDLSTWEKGKHSMPFPKQPECILVEHLVVVVVGGGHAAVACGRLHTKTWPVNILLAVQLFTNVRACVCACCVRVCAWIIAITPRVCKGVVEAPWIVKPPGSAFYYLFYSAAHCCDGSGSYAVGVARATTITGPYEKYNGNPIIRSNTGPDGGARGLQSERGFDGPGHCSVIKSPSDPQTFVIFYHAYVLPATNGARALMMDTLTFSTAAAAAAGWPQLTTGTRSPSTTSRPLPPV